jgi:hypothetical protein
VKGSPELKQAGTGMDVARCMRTHSVTQTSGNCVTGWRKRRFFVPRQRLIAAAVLSCVVFAPSQAYSECMAKQEEGVALVRCAGIVGPGQTG